MRKEGHAGRKRKKEGTKGGREGGRKEGRKEGRKTGRKRGKQRHINVPALDIILRLLYDVFF